MEHTAIIRRVRAGKEAEFETALRDFFVAAMGDAHTTGAQVIRPFEGSDDRCYGILRSFPDAADRDAFYASEAYQAWSEKVAPLVEGEPERRELHGLEAFFRQGGASAPPPAWKMALVTWLGVNLVTTPFLMVLMPIIAGMAGLPFPWDNFVFNIFVVATLTWVVMPALMKFFGAWVNARSNVSGHGVDAPTARGFWGQAWGILFEQKPVVTLASVGYGALRFGVGLLLAVYHGLPKLMAAPGYFLRGEPWRDVDLVVALGLPLPGLMALMAGVIQCFGALAIAFGVLTRANALLVLSTLVVAVYWNAIQGADNQVAILYLVAVAGIALIGKGSFSVGGLFRKK